MVAKNIFKYGYKKVEFIVREINMQTKINAFRKSMLYNWIKLCIFIITFLLAYIGDINLKKSLNFGDLVSPLFSAVLILAGIWISSYFLFLQFYKNRYPLDLLKEFYLNIVKRNILNVLFTICFGSIVIFLKCGILCQATFCLFSLLTIFGLLIETYNSNKSLMVNTYIEEYIKSLDNDLKNNILNKEKLNDIFKKLSDIFEECVVREEYYICIGITKQTCSVFKSLIIEANKIILEKSNDKDELKYFYRKIINYSRFQIESIKNCTSSYFLNIIADQIIGNVITCIEIDNLTLFKKYIHSMNISMYELLMENNDNLNNLLIEKYCDIVDSILTKKKDIEWIHYLVDDTSKMIMSLNYSFKDINLKHIAKLLGYTLNKCYKYDDQELYDFVFDAFKKFSLTAARINHSCENTIVFYALYAQDLIDNKDEQKIDDFIDLIDNMQTELSVDDRWINFVVYFLTELQKKIPLVYDGRIRDLSENVFMGLLNNNSTNTLLVIPNYKKMVLDNRKNIEEIGKIVNDIESLINKTVLKNNINIFYILLEILNDILYSLDKNDRQIQELMYKSYLFALDIVSDIENKQFIEICMSQINKCIRHLDKENLISKEFGNILITKLGNMASKDYFSNEKFACSIVETLHGFMVKDEEVNYILKHPDARKVYYIQIYHCGLCAIETNQESTLRRVSNAIGWLIISSIERGESEFTQYLIDRAVELYDIARKMKITEKTLTFMCTLFTTIGTYCCKKPIYFGYRDKIIHLIQNEKIEMIKTAIELRTSENDTWNELFDNKTKEFSGAFLRKFNEVQKTSAEIQNNVVIIKKVNKN